MPVRTRAKAAARGPLQRRPTQFGELETTPTCRHHGSPLIPSMGNAAVPPTNDFLRQETQVLSQTDDYDGGLDDGDFARLEDAQGLGMEHRPSTTFQWSETESLARRSSPLRPGDTPRAGWKFDAEESLPALSSPRSGRDKLPDTAPLYFDRLSPTPLEAPRSSKKVDFSETASTMLRSSPFGFGDSVKEMFDFVDNGLTPTQPPKDNYLPWAHQPAIPAPSSSHLPMDNIYDITPGRENRRRGVDADEVASKRMHQSMSNPCTHETMQTSDQPGNSAAKTSSDDAGKPRDNKSALPSQHDEVLCSLPWKNPDGSSAVPSSDTVEASVAAMQNERGRKRKQRKQRPKPPLPFDNLTQKLRDQPAKPSPKGRMPIVSALQESVQPSSSPAAVPKRRAPAKRAQPKKKAKPAPKAQKATPLVNEENGGSDLGKCLAPTKQPTKRGKQARKQNKVSPCLKPDASKPKPAALSEPIVVSSDSDSSAILSRSSSPLLSNLHTAKSPRDDAASEKCGVDQVVRREARPEQPVGVINDSPPAFALAQLFHETPLADMDAKATKTSRKTATVAVDNSGRTVPADNRQVLTSQDANIGIRKAAGSLKQRVISGNPSPIRISPGKQEASQPCRKLNLTARQSTRNYSVSVHGSPLPVQRQTAAQGSRLVEIDSMDHTFSEESTYLNPPQFSRPRKGKCPLPATELPFSWSGRQVKYAQGSGGQSSDTKAPHASQHQEPTIPAMQEVSGGVHAQILASLQDLSTLPDEPLCKAKTGAEEESPDGGSGLESGQKANPPDKLAQELHRLVGTMMEHLVSKKETGQRIADIYRTKTAGCVDRIQSRHIGERRALAEQLRDDGNKFSAVVQNAKTVLKENSRMREGAIRELKQTMTERRKLFERATSSLRAVHRQLLNDDVHLNTDMD